MKLNKSLITCLATGLLATTVAVAQPAGGGGGGGGGGGRGNFQGRARMLDDQQMQLYREAAQKDGEKLRALDEKLRVAQKELMQATLAATYDEKAVKEKADAVAKIQVELTVLRAKALATVAPTMKPEQKEQLYESRFAIMMLTGSGFDMGGGGFGRQGGGPGGADHAGGAGGPGGGRRGGGGGGGGGTGR